MTEIALTAQQRSFADEIAAFFDQGPMSAAVAAYHDADPAAPDRTDALRAAHRVLGARGLLAPGWPSAYGGRGLGPVETALVHRELVRHGLPDLLFVVSVCYAGNLLLLAADDSVREEFLPRIASGELTSCTLYSESGAGSDLAALRTRAEPAPGGGYRLFGVKTYSQATEHARYGLVAARTAPAGDTPHQGITLFWAPLEGPGVAVRPEPCLSDHPFSVVEFDGLHVPDAYVVGAPGEAWPLLNAALAVERTGLEAHLKLRGWLDTLAARIRASEAPVAPAAEAALADLEIRVDAGGFLAWEQIGRQAHGELDHVGAAMSKWWNTEQARPLVRLAQDLGPAADPPGAAPGSRPGDWYREAPGLTLSAGSSEIMLHSIAGAHLRVQTADAAAGELDDAAAGFRRRLRGFLAAEFPDLVAAAAGAAVEAGPDRGPGDAWAALVRSGAVRLTLPTGAGGLGSGLADSVVAAEEFGRVLLRAPYQDTVAVAELAGAEGPRRTWAERAARGALTAALAAGPAGLRGAGPAGDLPLLRGGTLTGRATAVPHADTAELLVVAALPADGPGLPESAEAVLVAVRRDQPGVVLDREDALGLTDLYTVRFRKAEVVADGVLTGVGDAPFAALLDRYQLRQAGYLLGLSAQAFDLTLDHTKRRRQFGQSIASFQHVSLRLAALTARLFAARTLIGGLALRHDRGTVDPARSAAALALVADLARDTTADAVQLHGAHGYTLKAPVQRFYRHAAVESRRLGSPQELRAWAAAHWLPGS
ncbi:acyl-CoA dehydrogenase family protein [Streptomyces sp. NPDC020141]|uniref:acyl-CoA dehydrogenase family protein n=1 Tax=Streptomyces sp. NPDC020141 TaxID=3365065 RepID=UPI00378FA3CD